MESLPQKLKAQNDRRFLDKLEGPIPRKTLSTFEPWMCEKIIEVGAQGGSLTRMAIMCGVTPSLLRTWSTKTDSKAIDAVVEAVEIGRAISMLYFEEIGLQASSGLIKNHASSTYQFLMKNMFRDFYRDEQVTKHEGGIRHTITPDMTPVLAAQKYREMLAAENDRAFDDFLGD